MMPDTDWSKSHCGVLLCSFNRTLELMPEVDPILRELHCSKDWWWHDKLIDVKVHMLMPGQYPCVPNWHCDFLPRDEHGKRIEGAEPSGEKMYLWVSGPPLTEFWDCDDFYSVPAGEWFPFTQADKHRGVAATDHCWRCMIRVIPARFAPSGPNHGQQRRHSQVYLDAENFTW